MNIGFVSTWFERGAAYVTKAYIDALKENNEVFVYARGGEQEGINDPKWDLPFVTWGLRLYGTHINFKHFSKWIKSNNIECIFFNEQHEFEIVHKVKKHFPKLKIGSYIDYYKENTVAEFKIYDFLICNTKRHYSVFKWHPQCYYVPWGTDVNLFKPYEKEEEELTFFHSAGMSLRKGTKLLIEAFICGELYKSSKLLIHSQLDLEKTFNYTTEYLKKHNIEIIQKTVTAPGLYKMGDVYVYPTTLDGLGLTLYEALSSGLPVITTNNAPMNEVINKDIGYLIEVDFYHSRSDAYYWPLSICKKESLIEGMMWFVSNRENLSKIKTKARTEALKKWDWEDRFEEVNEIFSEAQVVVNGTSKINSSNYRSGYIKKATKYSIPDIIVHFLKKYIL